MTRERLAVAAAVVRCGWTVKFNMQHKAIAQKPTFEYPKHLHYFVPSSFSPTILHGDEAMLDVALPPPGTSYSSKI